MSQSKRKLEPVKSNPGIYKIWTFSQRRSGWVDTGKFLASRQLLANGTSKREKAVFLTLAEAKAFRSGKIHKLFEGSSIHRHTENTVEALTFVNLIEEWKGFHFLKIEAGTRTLYDRKLKHLRFLENIPVEQINTSTIDDLVKFWMTDYPHDNCRQNFREELKILKTILHFYRRRKDPSYVVPVERDHFDAATITRSAKNEVKALSLEDLQKFLHALQTYRNPILYPLALTQFCLGLRIGEACGLSWESIDLENRLVKIQQVVIWNDRTWEPSIKKYTKNQNHRFLYIPDVLAAELIRLKEQEKEESDLIFHQNKKPLNRNHIGQVYNRVLRQLGIQGASGTHFLRRTFATLANELTGDFYAVSKILDHSSTDVTQRYVRPMVSQAKRVAEAVNGALMLPAKTPLAYVRT